MSNQDRLQLETQIPQGGIILTKNNFNEALLGAGRPATPEELLKIEEMGRLYDDKGRLIESLEEGGSNEDKLRQELGQSQKEIREYNRGQSGNY